MNDLDTADDWISALAKQATSGPEAAGVASKQERIERRKAKKRRRQQARNVGSDASSGLRKSADSDGVIDAKRSMSRRSEFYLQKLDAQIESVVTHERQQGQEFSRKRRLYQSPDSLKRGKATSETNKWSEETIQPRKRDYGGLGIARPSMYLPLQDVSFVPKFEEEFAQHIPGFFGKQRTKAMKRQLDGNMLWRRMAEKKTNSIKVDGKKLSEMTPDQRVDAMIKAGML